MDTSRGLYIGLMRHALGMGPNTPVSKHLRNYFLAEYGTDDYAAWDVLVEMKMAVKLHSQPDPKGTYFGVSEAGKTLLRVIRSEELRVKREAKKAPKNE